jgi:hypothetical protein
MRYREAIAKLREVQSAEDTDIARAPKDDRVIANIADVVLTCA